MRRVLPILTLGALLAILAPAAAQGETGGAEAVQAGATETGGARYATLPPEPKGDSVKKKPAKKKRRGKKRRKAKPKPVVVTPAPSPTPPVSDHVFPVQGPYSFGGKDSRFGAGRRGHTHQGQDLAAPLGTPVVAPWAGVVEAVKYQAGGAGYYVVLDGDGEDRDYVFMHLRKGSTLVVRGQAVAKGQQIAQVGSTGSSSGPHLHFEIWTGGGWYTGGEPIDPLPFLQAWL